MGDQSGAFAVLFAKESIGAAVATSAAPHSNSPKLSTCPACDLETPDTYAQAHAGLHSKIWRAAEEKEFGGLRAVGTFEELGGTSQRGINIISAKWVYFWKGDEFGNVVRAEARLVARGFDEREGIVFFDTFSPCPSVMSIRFLAALACELDLDLCHFDAKQAFVQSDFDEVVYIRLSPGCGALSGKAVRLRRSLYGLEQVSQTWHYHLVRGMKALGFEQCEADACAICLVEDGGVSVVVFVHVDDIFAIGLKT